MKFCSQCFNDTEIKAIIDKIDNSDTCDVTKLPSAHIYDTDKHSLLTENFDSLLNIYTPVSELGQNFDKVSAVRLKYELMGKNWDIFNPETCEHTDVYNILKSICVNKYEEMRELFDEDVLIQELADTKYKDEHSLLRNSSWEDFTYNLKHNNRFSSSYINPAVLQKICITSSKSYSKGTKFYRGRLSPINGLSAEEMGAPPVELTSDGRINSAGIRCLYLANDIGTTINEVRAGIFDYITVGVFELLEDITVVDFREIDRKSAFEFEAKGFDLREYALNKIFLNKMNSEISKTIRKNDLKLDYIPTQYICDHIKSIGMHSDPLIPKYAGIVYNSTLYKDGYNLAIFYPELFKCINTKVYQVESLEYNTKPKIKQ